MASQNILIIEDEEDLCELVRCTLEREKFAVSEAESGESGLESISLKKPDLILLDLMLPGKDGLQICRELKRDKTLRDIPVVMMTARGEESDIVTGLELDLDDPCVAEEIGDHDEHSYDDDYFQGRFDGF